MAHDRDYSQLTVTSQSTRCLIGYLSVPKLESLLSDPSCSLNLNDPVSRVMNRFDKKRGNVYRVITPDTPLEELEEFLKAEEFAVITDEARRFVLGVATRGDLAEYLKRRPQLG